VNRIRRRVVGVLAVAGCAAAVAQPAAAQSPTISAYSGSGPSVQTNVEPHNSLPFTGVDVGLVVGAGVALAGAGLALRRVAVVRR
jgi:hypothetical protein